MRINFYGIKKAEKIFDMVDFDLVTVDFEVLLRKKIDLGNVLKELGRSTFDFAIVNRVDAFIQ